MKQATDKKLEFKEAQRLSGLMPADLRLERQGISVCHRCPGRRALGRYVGRRPILPDRSHRVHSAFRLRGLRRKRRVRPGSLRIHLTEELSEVSYFDQVQLIAIDHPADTEIYSNEKWKSPPFPEFRLYGLSRADLPGRCGAFG